MLSEPPAGPLDLLECHESQLGTGEAEEECSHWSKTEHQRSPFWKKVASLGECLLAQLETESWVESVGCNYFTTFANNILKDLKPAAKSRNLALSLPAAELKLPALMFSC